MTRVYTFVVSALILADASLEIVDGLKSGTDFTAATSIEFQAAFGIIQALLAIDVIIRAARQVFLQDKFSFFYQKENLFDIAVTGILLWTLGGNTPIIRILRSLRVLRLFRMLSIISPYLGELMMILSAVDNSYWAVGHVIVLVMVYFTYFAIIGVLLFKEANPYYFGGE
jgi:hypothetical protein